MSLSVAFGVTVLEAGLSGSGIDGIGTVTRELLTRLRERPGMDIRPFAFSERVSGHVPGATPVGTYQLQAFRAFSFRRSFSGLKNFVRGRVDLIHATDHQIPKMRGTPLLATLMDAIPLSHPEWVNYRNKRLINALWRRSARWANRIVTISEFSRDEISRHFGIPEKRISVMPLGVDPRWFEKPDAGTRQRMQATLALPERYFLFVGTLQPRKNLDLLIRAHSRLPADLRADVPLLVAGREGWGCETLVARMKSGVYPDVRWLRYVPHEAMSTLFAQATALAFPSLFEGFGLPVLEGFAAGVPVLASNGTSIPEVAGDAAEMLDPTDVDAWTEAMQRVATSPSRREELRSKGLERAREFSWERATDRLVEIYHEVLG